MRPSSFTSFSATFSVCYNLKGGDVEGYLFLLLCKGEAEISKMRELLPTSFGASRTLTGFLADDQ